MLRIIVVALLSLAACAFADTPSNAGPAEMQGWRLTSGKTPSKSEFAAVVATCENRSNLNSQGKTLDTCLYELGLKRTE
jgi:hypothetical protein